MTWARISTSSSRPGRPRNSTSTVSSKLKSQNGSLRFLGLRTCALSRKERAYSLCGSIRKMRWLGLAARICAQDDGHPARLADAGRAEEGEVLAQHLVDLDVGADRAVLLQVADVDGVGAGSVVDDTQGVAAERMHVVADHRVAGDAALEAREARVDALDLAQQVDARSERAVGRAATPVEVGDDAHDRDPPVSMARNLPTVVRAPSAASERADRASRTLAWAPVTDTTCPRQAGGLADADIGLNAGYGPRHSPRKALRMAPKSWLTAAQSVCRYAL